MQSNPTHDPADNYRASIVATAVSPPSAAQQRRTGLEPTYPLEPLLTLTRLAPEEFAEKVGISRATAYRRAKDGVKWSEADDWAVACRYLPYDVWPEWALADPADWCDIPPDPEQAADASSRTAQTSAAA